MTRRLRPLLALAGAAVAGGVVAVAVAGMSPTPTSAHRPRLSTALVRRTDLATTVLTEGTLGYAPSPPVVDEASGTYTSLPAPGTVIGVGQALYRVDDLPVVLLQGATSAWRAFAPGIADGPDVAELQSNLIALGDAAGLLTAPTGEYGFATAVAVERWQAANGLTPTGEIPFGGVVFLPGPIVVGAPEAGPGQPASPGDVPYVATTTGREVTVPLNPDLPAVGPGEAVSILLPSGARTPGRVAGVGPSAAATGATTANSTQPVGTGAATTSGTAAPGAATANVASVATIVPDDPSATGIGTGVAVQVSLTSQTAHDVLAAPIAALLALAGGGYGVEVVHPEGRHQLVPVTTGIFAGARVQVTGPGVDAGTRVVVAQ